MCLFCFSCRTELVHHGDDLCLDCICARFQQLTRVVALAFLILAFFDVLASSSSELQLQLSIDVDLGNTQADCLCNLICRDTGSTMQYQRLAIGNCLDLAQTVKAQTSPVCRILAMDVTDTCSQEVNAQLSDRLAFLRICQFTGRNDTVFFTADAADLTLSSNA